jgi:hypothetical protein
MKALRGVSRIVTGIETNAFLVVLAFVVPG